MIILTDVDRSEFGWNASAGARAPIPFVLTRFLHANRYPLRSKTL
jgi:hypothetical protein